MTDWRQELHDATEKASELAEAVIRKDGPSSTPYCIYSKSGRKLGCYSSRKKANERLRQIEFFKNKGSEDDGLHGSATTV